MTNEELKPEMKVLVDVEGVLKPAKVIGPTRLREGPRVTITGWVVHIEPSALPHTTTADKIHPRDADWRPAAFLLLDKKLSEFTHLNTTTNPGGDFEVPCSKCGEEETYSGAGDREVDALTFALKVP